MQGFEYNLSLHATLAPGGPGRFKGIRLQRCRILDAWSVYPYGGQGLFASHADGLATEDSILDGNGLPTRRSRPARVGARAP